LPCPSAYLEQQVEENPEKSEDFHKVLEPKEVTVYTTDVSAKPPAMVSFCGGKENERSPLVKGPAGFLVAHFDEGLKTTELPNVVLDTLASPPKKKKEKKKKSKAKKAKKKGLAKKKGPAKKKAKKKDPPAEESGSEETTPGKTAKGKCALYGPMFYKNGHSIGIRAKTGLCNQVLSFGGKKASKKTKDQMLDIGRKACLLLEEGRSLEETKKKAEELVAA